MAELEKLLAEKEKKIFSNLSKIQAYVKNCNVQIQKLTEENKKLESESQLLNRQKLQKLFEETKARMFEQFEQAKMLSVENLLLPIKCKSQKNSTSGNAEKAVEGKIPDNSNSAVGGNVEKSVEVKIPNNSNSADFQKMTDEEKRSYQIRIMAESLGLSLEE